MGTVLCVAASVAASLLPPLLLARVIDRLTAGLPLSVLAVLLYFGSLALEGVLSCAQESLLVLFGQKMTHALRSEMSRKLTRLPAGTLAEAEPRRGGRALFRRCGHGGGSVHLRHHQHGGGCLPHLSIMAVIAVKNTGLALILLLVLPLLPCSPAMCRSGCWPRSWITAARSPPFPGRCRKRCTTSAPSARWAGRLHGAPV